jgi:asparagine synthase (glutamine-hydrolysing)
VCGIVGVFDSSGRLPSPEIFLHCIKRLQRRGPDGSGIWTDSFVRLGHRRLAVIDLSPAGHQPMLSADGRFVIVFNGEIYNHAELRRHLSPPGGWRGTSDTETLLEAYREWGSKCLDQLNGMFAFAIWDSVQRTMFIARDRLGVKPLYYSWRGGRLVFASRPAAMLDLLGGAHHEIDFGALRAYLELGYIPAPLSLYKHVSKLEPGHFVQIRSPRASKTRYWDYRHLEPDHALAGRSEGELIDDLDERVRRATAIRLTSDVPLGAFLSGGTDSALVVACMKASGMSTPKAFTIAFQEREYDEGPAAARIAQHLGVDHVVETLSTGDLLQLLPLYVEEFDEPFADSSAFPTMAVARLARKQVTVALTGDGGDELFGGYHYYPLTERLSLIQHLPGAAKIFLSAALGMLPSHKAKLLRGALWTRSRVALFHYLRSYSKDFAPLLNDAVLQRTSSSADEFEHVARRFAAGLTGAEVGMRLDLALMLANGYLQKVDVATMASSVEARNPLLDYRLVEWSMKLPVRYKIRGSQTKYLLKKVLCRYLPKRLVYRPKRGFGMPVAQWLRGPLRSWSKELLHDQTLMSALPLEPRRVQALFDSHMSGARDAHPLLWAVLMLLSYVARHDRGIGLPPVPMPARASGDPTLK